MRISQAYLRYISEYLIIKGTDRNQITHYRAAARLFVEIVGDLPLEEITLDNIAEFTTGLYTHGKTRGVNTVCGYIKQLRVVLRYWRNRGEKTLDWSIIPIPKREPVMPAFLTEEEVNKMIECSDLVRTKFIIALLYGSGLRVSELKSLNRGIDNQFTIIGKGRKPRICFLDERSKFYMQLYLSTRKDNSEALIVTADGKRASVSTLQLIIRNARLRAGINKKATPHTLRHSFATNYIKNDGNIRTLAVLMGHNSIETTAIYTHVVNNDLYREYKRHHTC